MSSPGRLAAACTHLKGDLQPRLDRSVHDTEETQVVLLAVFGADQIFAERTRYLLRGRLLGGEHDLQLALPGDLSECSGARASKERSQAL